MSIRELVQFILDKGDFDHIKVSKKEVEYVTHLGAPWCAEEFERDSEIYQKMIDLEVLLGCRDGE